MTDTKVIQFNVSDESLIDLASERRQSGNLDGALSTLFYLEERGVRLIDLYAEFSLVFMQLGLYTHAIKYWFKYLASAPKTKYARAYNGLGACFFYLGNYGMSGYYFERQVSVDPDKEYQFDGVMFEYYDSVVDVEKPDFYVCYPPKYLKPEVLITEAEELFDNKDFEGAIETYSLISPASEYYCDAQIRISVCYLCLNELDKAVKTVEDVIEKYPNNINAIINILGLLATIDRRDDIPKYLKMAEDLNVSDGDLCYKLATIYCDVNDNLKAIKYLEKAVEFDRFDINSNFLLAMVYYNEKEFEKSKRHFSLCYRLTKSGIAKYYINLVEKTEKSGVFSEITYLFNVQKDEEIRRNNLIKNIIKYEKKTLAKLDKNTVIELLDWAFAVDSNLIEPLTAVLLNTSSVAYRKYYLNKLLDPFTDDEIKKLVITCLVEKGYDKKIGLTFGVFFSKLQLIRAEFDKEKNQLFTKAYALAFGKLAPLDNEQAYKIRDGAYRLYYQLKENGNIKKVGDLNALAGAIAILSGLKIAKRKSAIANYFYTQATAINEIIALAQE